MLHSNKEWIHQTSIYITRSLQRSIHGFYYKLISMVLFSWMFSKRICETGSQSVTISVSMVASYFGDIILWIERVLAEVSGGLHSRYQTVLYFCLTFGGTGNWAGCSLNSLLPCNTGHGFRFHFIFCLLTLNCMLSSIEIRNSYT